jgi:selenocysteine lyase/cysteine desulfurase
MKGAAATGLLALLKPSTASAHGWVPEEFRHGPLPTKLMPYPLIKGDPRHERFWQEVRRAFPLPPAGHYCHYNTGTTGSQPFFSINNLAVYNLYKSRDPVYWMNNLADDFPELFAVPTGGSHQSAIYAELADMFNGNTDEFVLSYNTSDGMLNCTTGIHWNAGDRIVTTNMEHPCGLGTVAWARDNYGVSVSVVDIPFDGGFNLTVDQFVELFRPALSAPLPAGAKQVLVFSHISFRTGIVMPAKELTALAHSFDNSWVMIDSAHGWGQLVMDCKDIGADFIAGAGHKWLCGGPGTGILYVRNSSGSYPLIPFNPWTEGWGDLWTVPSARFNDATHAGARGNKTLNTGMQSRGEWNRCASFAMADTASWYHYIGLQNIYKRGTDMAAYFQKKVTDRWGPKALWVNPAVDQRFKGFVTAFNPFKGNTDSANYATQSAAIGKVVSTLQASIDKDLNPTGKTPIYLASRNWSNQNADRRSNRACFRVSTHAMYSSREETDFVIEQIAKEVDASGIPQLP